MVGDHFLVGFIFVFMIFIVENGLAGFDFDPNGEYAGTLDRSGGCLISTISTDYTSCYLKLETNYARGS